MCAAAHAAGILSPPMAPAIEPGIEHNEGIMFGLGLGLSLLSCEGYRLKGGVRWK